MTDEWLPTFRTFAFVGVAVVGPRNQQLTASFRHIPPLLLPNNQNKIQA